MLVRSVDSAALDVVVSRRRIVFVVPLTDANVISAARASPAGLSPYRRLPAMALEWSTLLLGVLLLSPMLYASKYY